VRCNYTCFALLFSQRGSLLLLRATSEPATALSVKTTKLYALPKQTRILEAKLAYETTGNRTQMEVPLAQVQIAIGNSSRLLPLITVGLD
jgi:hypothetical protein